ncbi:MAG: hypothetical protein Q7T82_10995 [Armatimonadota bacterium]|nr:hypothetical protein [Armatimonadota bacterium]
MSLSIFDASGFFRRREMAVTKSSIAPPPAGRQDCDGDQPHEGRARPIGTAGDVWMTPII